jgi:hypothetical protein
MPALTAFLPYVLPHTAGASEPLATQMIRSACIEFCAKSTLVQEVATQNVAAGVSEYDVDLPTGMVLVKVLGVMHNGTWLAPVSTESIRDSAVLVNGEGSASFTTSTPTVYFQRTPTASSVQLYPVPDVALAKGLTIRAAFSPARTATSVPDVLFDDWADEIGAGAVARLLMLPCQPISNPSLAGSFLRMFDAGVSQASVIARSGLVATSSRVQPARFIA